MRATSPVSRRAVAQAAATVVVVVGALDRISWQLLRRSLGQALGLSAAPSPLGVVAVVAAAGAGLLWLRRRRGVDSMVATALALAFVFGLCAQWELGARLQSDGHRYFAYLRSLAFDRDVNLANDYRLLGLSEDPGMTRLTATGHVPSPFPIGPALAWAPSILAGHAAVLGLNAWAGATLAPDGTAYPYRQAVCIASLIYGLLGFWFSYRLACRFVEPRLAALATLAIGLGSFMLWYLVQEPTMSHAVSMCASAAFLSAWAAERPGTMGRWALLGLLLGLAMTVRWQNALLVLFPGADWLSRAWNAQRAGAGRAESPSIARAVVVFGACALAGFLPQMLAWQAIYGTPLAVSPLSPKMLWAQPAVGRLLWSSNNGLFSTSPVTYVAALGLLLLPRRDRLFGWSALGVMTLAIYVNASVEDWWAGASYGARRFDGVVPLFVVGLGLAAGHLAALVARRPAFAVNFLLLAFVAWNLTFMAAGRTGGERLLPPLSFGAMSARQAEVLHGWIGHPFSYPASLWFSARTGLAPGRYDRLSAEFLSDASRPYGKIDIGGNDEDHLLGGWHGIETDPDGTTWRWTSDASTLLVPLDHPAPLLLQARIVPFTYSTSPDVSVGARVNGRRYGPIRVPAGGWQRIEIPVEARAWKAGVNVVEWLWMNAAAPSTVGLGADTRVLGARVDFVRVEVAR